MQCVMHLAQIKVNSMAIVRMKSLDVNDPVKQSGMLSSVADALTSNVEQVSELSPILLKNCYINIFIFKDQFYC